MAFEIPGFNRSWVAGGTAGTAGSDMSLPVTLNSIALPSMQYLFVVFVSNLVLPVNASGSAYKNLALGVLQNKASCSGTACHCSAIWCFPCSLERLHYCSWQQALRGRLRNGYQRQRWWNFYQHGWYC